MERLPRKWWQQVPGGPLPSWMKLLGFVFFAILGYEEEFHGWLMSLIALLVEVPIGLLIFFGWMWYRWNRDHRPPRTT